MNKKFCFFLFIGLFILAQEKDVLIQEKNALIQEIKYTKDQLNQTQLDKKNNLTTLLLYQKDIDLRKSLIENYITEIGIMELNVDSLTSLLKELHQKDTILNSNIHNVEQKINDLSSLFAQVIKQIYLSNKNENLLQLFVENSSLDQIVNQYIYLKTIKNTAQTLAQKLHIEKDSLDILKNELHQNQNQIQKSIVESNNLIEKKQLTMEEKANQLDSLESQTGLQRDLINTLNNQIDLLKKEILKKENSAQKIESEIKKINKKIISAKNKDMNILTSNFQEQKGHLDWPSEKCIVMSSFGTVLHPKLPGIKYINYGIELAVPKNSYIKSVSSGIISSIIIQNNSLKSVIIEHGLYFTVYTNLSEVYVKQGDEVRKQENLGKAYIKENHKTGLIEFQLWKEFESLDPKIWLKKR
tara:strand:- start:95 stop:1333 length:1239 start_codon:yes stop_codon:yes gene_type:complete